MIHTKPLLDKFSIKLSEKICHEKDRIFKKYKVKYTNYEDLSGYVPKFHFVDIPFIYINDDSYMDNHVKVFGKWLIDTIKTTQVAQIYLFDRDCFELFKFGCCVVVFCKEKTK
jgi:hypothetical protein